MKLSCLLPTNHIRDLQPSLDFVFMEPIQDRRYISECLHSPNEFKLLDNGFIEFNGHGLGVFDLIDYFHKVNATHVIATDKLGDWPFNSHMAKRTARYVGKQRTFVVLAGPTPLRFWWQTGIARLYGFAGVCLPYRLNRIPTRHTTIHLLGYRHPERHIDFPSDCTMDTTEPVNAALRGWNYEHQGFASFKRHPNYQNIDMTPTQLT